MLDRENTIQILAARSKESRPPAWSLPSGGSKAANSRANPVGLIHELDLTNESRCGNSGCEEHSDDPTSRKNFMRSIKERATSVCRRTYRCNSSGAMTGSLLGPS